MEMKVHPTHNKTYETSELKLAALLLSAIPGCSIEISGKVNSRRKTIKIVYPADYEDTVFKLEKNFINKIAVANVYGYNKALNLIRDRLRGKRYAERISQ